MNPARAIPWLALLAAAAAAEPAGPTAYFANGDRLAATLAAIDGPTARFESPCLAAPASIHLASLLELRGDAAAQEPPAGHEAVVTLSNGNILRGQLAALTDDTIALDTWFAGRLELRRTMVDSLHIVDRSRSIYAGPRNAEGWVLSDNEQPPWRFEAGTMTSNRPGSAGRDLHLPDRISLSFDLAWRGSLRLRLAVFSDELDALMPDNACLLDFNRRYVSLSKHSGAGNAMQRMNIGTAGIPQLDEREKVRIEFLADRADGNFLLFVDGTQVGEWRDPDADTPVTGGGIVFITEDTDDTRPLRVSRIVVEAWDGRPRLTDAPEADPAAPPPPAGSQRIRLRNADVVTGRVLGIEDERLAIETRHGKVRLPISRMSTVILHHEEDRSNWDLYQRPKLMNGDVRAWFPEGGCLVFRLDGIDAGHLLGFNQAFGHARLRRDAFHRIEFNIYKEELEPRRPSASSW